MLVGARARDLLWNVTAPQWILPFVADPATVFSATQLFDECQFHRWMLYDNTEDPQLNPNPKEVQLTFDETGDCLFFFVPDSTGQSGTNGTCEVQHGGIIDLINANLSDVSGRETDSYEYVTDFNDFVIDGQNSRLSQKLDEESNIIARYMLSASNVFDVDGSKLLWLSCDDPDTLSFVPLKDIAPDNNVDGFCMIGWDGEEIMQGGEATYQTTEGRSYILEFENVVVEVPQPDQAVGSAAVEVDQSTLDCTYGEPLKCRSEGVLGYDCCAHSEFGQVQTCATGYDPIDLGSCRYRCITDLCEQWVPEWSRVDLEASLTVPTTWQIYHALPDGSGTDVMPVWFSNDTGACTVSIQDYEQNNANSYGTCIVDAGSSLTLNFANAQQLHFDFVEQFDIPFENQADVLDRYYTSTIFGDFYLWVTRDDEIFTTVAAELAATIEAERVRRLEQAAEAAAEIAAAEADRAYKNSPEYVEAQSDFFNNLYLASMDRQCRSPESGKCVSAVIGGVALLTNDCLAEPNLGEEMTCQQGYIGTQSVIDANYVAMTNIDINNDLSWLFTCVPEECEQSEMGQWIKLRSGQTWAIAPPDARGVPNFFQCWQTQELNHGEYLATYELMEDNGDQVYDLLTDTTMGGLSSFYGGYMAGYNESTPAIVYQNNPLWNLVWYYDDWPSVCVTFDHTSTLDVNDSGETPWLFYRSSFTPFGLGVVRMWLTQVSNELFNFSFATKDNTDPNYYGTCILIKGVSITFYLAGGDDFTLSYVDSFDQLGNQQPDATAYHRYYGQTNEGEEIYLWETYLDEAERLMEAEAERIRLELQEAAAQAEQERVATEQAAIIAEIEASRTGKYTLMTDDIIANLWYYYNADFEQVDLDVVPVWIKFDDIGCDVSLWVEENPDPDLRGSCDFKQEIIINSPGNDHQHFERVEEFRSPTNGQQLQAEAFYYNELGNAYLWWDGVEGSPWSLYYDGLAQLGLESMPLWITNNANGCSVSLWLQYHNYPEYMGTCEFRNTSQLEMSIGNWELTQVEFYDPIGQWPEAIARYYASEDSNVEQASRGDHYLWMNVDNEDEENAAPQVPPLRGSSRSNDVLTPEWFQDESEINEFLQGEKTWAMGPISIDYGNSAMRMATAFVSAVVLTIVTSV